MAKSVVFACDVRGCEKTVTIPEAQAAQVCPPGWAVFEIVVRSATPVATTHDKIKSCTQERKVLCCPEHAGSMLAALPGGSHAALPGAR